MIVEFFEPCIPPRAGKKQNYRAGISKGGKAFLYKGKSANESEQSWYDILKDHAPEKPLEGACKLRIDLYFPLIGSDTNTKAKKAIAAYGVSYWMVTKPDAGNLGEAVQDVMTKLLYYKDDSQVVDLRITKHRSSSPGVKIRLEELNEAP